MKRTKKWWEQFTPKERSYIVFFEKESKKYCNYGGGGYLPDDCSECVICGHPIPGQGACHVCYAKYETIIKKGDIKIHET